jgi:hypothetical protein
MPMHKPPEIDPLSLPWSRGAKVCAAVVIAFLLLALYGSPPAREHYRTRHVDRPARPIDQDDAISLPHGRHLRPWPSSAGADR